MQILRDKGKTGCGKDKGKTGGLPQYISVEHVDSDPLQLLPAVSETY